MNERDFCYWLRGYIELGGGTVYINSEQMKVVKAHLDIVLRNTNQKETPTLTTAQQVTVSC